MNSRIATILLSAAAVCAPAFAVYEVGDKVENMCWTDVDNKKVCLDDFAGKVRVLVYNAGWCGPCNAEFDNLAPRAKEYDGKPVQFISLSAQGWSHGSAPTQQFLQEWRDKHSIPFLVAGSPGDAGNAFGQEYIPNAQVIDANGTLTYKDVAPEVDTLFSAVNSALGSHK